MSRWIFFFLLTVNLSCHSNNFIIQDPAFDQLEIYYVPWELKTEARWTEYEVRDTTISYVSYFCTADKTIIERFRKCLLSDNLEAVSYVKGVPPYMLIDIGYISGKTDKVIIGPNSFLEYNQSIYSINEELKKWIKDFIPEATFPIGKKCDQC